MACITERKRQGQTSKWQAVVRVKGHPAVVQTFDTYQQAEKFGADVESTQRKSSKSAALALQKMRRKLPHQSAFYERPLQEIVMDFAYGPADRETGQRPGETLKAMKPSKRISPSSKRRCAPEHLRSIGAHWGHLQSVLDNIGDVILADAKSAWVLRYVDKMLRKVTHRGRPYSANTIGKHLALLKAACEAAAIRADVEDPKLYFSQKHLPKGCNQPRERRLEPGEHQKIMARLNSERSVKGRHWRCLYRLALETGARLQELVLAEWGEFAHPGLWSIPKEHTKKATARMVSLSPRARRIVNFLKKMAPPDARHVFHTFCTVNSVSCGWACRMKCAGVVGLTFHDLRHEAITRMVLHPKNIRPEVIRYMVGHKSADMTARYTHYRANDLKGLFDRAIVGA
jgi:integrase